MKDKAKSLLNYVGAGALAAGSIAAAPFTGGASLYAMPLAAAWASNTAANDAQRRQNAYNSPASQMARYREAGLNPNLVYSQGGPGNQASPVNYEVPELGQTGLRGARAAYENAKSQQMLNQYNAEAAWHNIDRVHQDALLKSTKQLGEVTRNQLLAAHIPYASDLAKYNAQANMGKAQTLLSEVNVKQAQLLNLQMDNRIKSEVLRDKQFANWLRQFGVERTDNIFLRGGARLWHDYAPMINQKLKR